VSYLPPFSADNDYLVDHSIFFYLVNKEGEFLEFFGKNLTASEVSNKMVKALKADQAANP
jgi:protein SCO1/2